MPETRHFCPHCEETVSLTTIHRHKQLYYNERTHTWTKKDRDFMSDSEAEQENDYDNEAIDYSSCNSSLEDNIDDPSHEDTLEQLKTTCLDLTAEDRALIEPSTSANYTEDEGDIDEGEFWEDAEEEDVDYDIEVCGDLQRNSGEECERGIVTSDEARSESGNDNCHEQEEEFHQPHSIITFLSVVIAIWSYRYNITQSALNALLKLFSLFLSLISSFSSSFLSVLTGFPPSVYKLKHFLQIKENNFTKYVVCPACHSLYTFEDCFELTGQPKMCSFTAFPQHPHQVRRLPCGERLLSEITLKNGKKKFYPRKYYCYKPIIESLAFLIKRKGFLKACEWWRLRSIPPNTYCDIYDGKIWKDFQYINNVPFLAVPHNLALMLNIDWFNPYKHSPYSVGAIYLVITNLPRSKRFKKENVILVPGPAEPSIHMNSYLDPLVKELQILFTDGFQTQSPDYSDPVIIRAALICSACDIPACRKVLGFCGHMSKQGCSKCTKEFEYDSINDKINFGGFDACPSRTEDDHRHQAFSAMAEKTPSSRDKIEKKYGSRFTSLMHLPYFDCVRFHIIDPMHNLFLGTAKYMMKSVWLGGDNPLIDKKFFPIIQKRVDNCVVPSSIGRIPLKIASSFMSFTADQWKSWTNTFSLFSLHGIIEGEDLECWRKFVQACHILTAPMITVEAADRGHRLLLEFCMKFEVLYGSHRVTPNMHLHTHVVDCIKDYGPVYSFWLFSFERYNGILGNFRTNQRSVELQLMRRFLTDLQIYDLQLPEEHIPREKLDFLLPPSAAGTLGDVSSLHNKEYLEITSASTTTLSSNFDVRLWSFTGMYQLGGVKSFELLNDYETVYLSECYNIMYPSAAYNSSKISSAVYKFSQYKLSDEVFGSQGSRSQRSSYVLARWCGSGAQIDSSNLRPALVHHYFKHSVSVEGDLKPHIFAAVEWFKPHPSRCILGDPVQVWCHDLFEPLGPATFLPVQRIESKFVSSVYKLQEETVLIVMPLQQKTFL